MDIPERPASESSASLLDQQDVESSLKIYRQVNPRFCRGIPASLRIFFWYFSQFASEKCILHIFNCVVPHWFLQVFNLCDKDGNGFITEEELAQICEQATSSGCGVNGILDNVMQCLNPNHEGLISFDEFKSGFEVCKWQLLCWV